MALEVKIRKQLSDFLLDLDFAAEKGILALFGASGCGKSMTLKCLAGIERPDAGRIALDGRVLYDSERRISLPPQKRKVGYMFQDYALFPNMTVRKNVLSGMGKNPDPAKVDQLLEKFRIDEIGERHPSEISGGQKQRTALARIIAQDPDVILLDEPLSALDSHLKWQLEKEMKETLLEAGVPVIIVSHSGDEVFRLSDRVCCLRKGKITALSETGTFFRQPGSRYAAELIGCRNIVPAEACGDHRIRIAAWDLEVSAGDMDPRTGIPLTPGQERGETTDLSAVSFAGILPQAFCPKKTEDTDLSIGISEISPFKERSGWTVFCRTETGDAPIEWRITADEGCPWKDENGADINRLYFRSGDVMLLSD